VSSATVVPSSRRRRGETSVVAVLPISPLCSGHQ
jgi:hypothetical protein